MATVKNGVVKAIGEGKATITGKAGNTTLKFTVTVNKASSSGGGNNGGNNGGNTQQATSDVKQPTISYEYIDRQASRGRDMIDEKLNQAMISYNGFPKNVNDLKKIDRSDGKGSEADGRQDGKYITVACFLAALAAYSEGRKSDGKAMMDYLLISPNVPHPTSGDLSYYFEYGNGAKTPWAFFDGSTPANKYTPNKPYTLTFEEWPYAPEAFPTYGITYERMLFHTDNHPCLKNNSTIAVYKASDGQWYLHPDKGYWSYALSTASMY